MHMDESSACMSGRPKQAWFPWRQKEGTGTHETRITDSCVPSCGSWNLTPGPLEDHLVPLIIELCLQPSKLYFKNLFSTVLVCLTREAETKVHNLFHTNPRFLKSCIKWSFPRPYCMKSPPSSKVDLAIQFL